MPLTLQGVFLISVMASTVDTDVVVLAVAKFRYIFLCKLWIEFGVGKHLKYLNCTTLSVIMEKKSHKIFSHFTTSQAVIRLRLLRTVAKGQHGKRYAQWMM